MIRLADTRMLFEPRRFALSTRLRLISGGNRVVRRCYEQHSRFLAESPTPSAGLAAIASFAGELPDGLDLKGNQISGFPTTAGTFTFTAQVTDKAGATAERTFTITVTGRPAGAAPMSFPSGRRLTV